MHRTFRRALYSAITQEHDVVVGLAFVQSPGLDAVVDQLIVNAPPMEITDGMGVGLNDDGAPSVKLSKLGGTDWSKHRLICSVLITPNRLSRFFLDCYGFYAKGIEEQP